MAEPDIEEFAKAIVTLVRDAAIQACDARLNPNARSVSARRWQEAATKSGHEAITELIPDIVDNTLFQLMAAIDGGDIELTFKTSNGKTVDLTEAGMQEMAGEYAATEEGWRQRYSAQRIND